MNDYHATAAPVTDRIHTDLHEPHTTQAKVVCPNCGLSVHNTPTALAYHASLHEPTAVHRVIRD